MSKTNLKSQLAAQLGLGHNSSVFRNDFPEGGRVYAICFDLDQ